jgi:hypothetical protein
MRMSLNFMPFNLFWINCIFNMMFSMLTSIECSYYLAALLNDYSYVVVDMNTPNEITYKSLELRPLVKHGDKYRNLLFCENKSLNFKYGEIYFDTLKGLIEENNITLLGVDLFYWIPNSICWNKHHWEHYSLINGFDDKKRVLYVFDENVYGYNEFEIPEDRLIKAISNYQNKPQVNIYRLSKDIERFELSIREVRDNAQRIVDEIKVIMPFDFWELSEKDFIERHMCDLISMRIFQIVNRHIANQLLMQELKEEILSPQIRSSLIKYCIDLQEGWTLVKKKLIRIYFSKYNKSAVSDINEKCKLLLQKEIDMWNMFLKYVQ